MIIEVNNVKCKLLGASDAEEAWITRYLSFADKGYMAASGRKSLLDLSGFFPGGLLPLVQDAAARDGIKIELLDKRTSRLVLDVGADLDWLRPYQLDAVDACVRDRRGIVRAPTGSGKGEMIVGLTRALPGRWLFLVHRETLVGQQAKRYTTRTGLEPNVLSGTATASWRMQEGLNLMTLQTLASRIRTDSSAVAKSMEDVDGLMVDECHVAPADIYYSAIEKCPAEYRIGFSGTPLDRTDNRSLMAIAALGKVIYQVKAKDLIEAGVLAMPNITVVKVRQDTAAAGVVKGGPRRMGAGAKQFKDVYDKLIAESDVRNNVIVSLAKRAAKPCIVFVKLVAHGKLLTKALQAEGVATEFVWGATKGRLEAIERLERGDSQVMIASVVFQEGVDIPSLESVIIASGGKSVIAALQRIGRGMRTNGGAKSKFEVFDILDMGSPMLERHSRRRMNTYVREGYETVISNEDGSHVINYKPNLKTRREKLAR